MSDLLLEGKENFLFLGGGRHTPLRFVQGGDGVKPKSLSTFWTNIQKRQAQLNRRSIKFAHLIAPDKHSVCQEVFPLEVLNCLGDQYLDAAPSKDLRGLVAYSRESLSADFRSYCYRVDTHFRPSGTLLMIREILAIVCGEEALALMPSSEELMFSRQPGWSGDLGSKLSPPKTEDCIRLSLPKAICCYSNRLAGGNNGIIDLYINRKYLSGGSVPGLGRVLVSGDSYGRDMARVLSLICQEVLFVRTPFLHLELVEAMKPNVVITQNAERYLSNVESDQERPVFFLYPFFKTNEYFMAAEAAETLSAVLSYGRQPYTNLIGKLSSFPAAVD